jgi:hypothetical protein
VTKLAYRFGKRKFGERVRDSNPNLSHREVAIRRRSTHFPNQLRKVCLFAVEA